MTAEKKDPLPVFFADSGTLVVVDLQPGFLDRKGMPKKATIAGALLDIEQAMRLGWGIVLLEYSFRGSKFGRTDPRILKAVDDYDKCTVIPKKNDSGSTEVLKACAECGYDTTVFRLLGVQAGGCVHSTAAGLRAARPESRVEISVDASGSSIKNYNWFDYVNEEVAGVILVNHKGEIVKPGRVEETDYRYPWDRCG